MKISSLFMATFLGTILPGSASPDVRWQIYGSNAGRNVGDWFRVISPGPSTKPFPIIWLSNKKISVNGSPEIFVALSRYQMIRIGRSVAKLSCNNRLHAEITPGSIQVFSKKDGGAVISCKLSQAAGCEFLQGLYAIARTVSVYDLAGGVNCKLVRR